MLRVDLEEVVSVKAPAANQHAVRWPPRTDETARLDDRVPVEREENRRRELVLVVEEELVPVFLVGRVEDVHGRCCT